MALRLRIQRRRPPLPRFFSSSSPDDNGNDRDPQPSSISSHFRDIKATPKHRPSGDHPLRSPTTCPSFVSQSQKQKLKMTPIPLAELQKLLSDFPSNSPPSDPSFEKDDQPDGSTDPSSGVAQKSLDWIKESLQGISRCANASSLSRDGVGSSGVNRMSLLGCTDSLRLRPEEGDAAAPRKVAGGVGEGVGLPSGIFGKEMKEGKAGKEKENLEKTKFSKSYVYEVLRSLADEGRKDFSLKELNERLIKLKEMEEKEMVSKSKNIYFGELREPLLELQLTEEQKTKNKTRKWELRMFRSPADEGRKDFSQKELEEKEMEEKEMVSKYKNIYFGELRESLLELQLTEEQKTKNKTRKWELRMFRSPADEGRKDFSRKELEEKEMEEKEMVSKSKISSFGQLRGTLLDLQSTQEQITKNKPRKWERRMLRSPADEGRKDFSLKELNEKEMEEKEMVSKPKISKFWPAERDLVGNPIDRGTENQEQNE